MDILKKAGMVICILIMHILLKIRRGKKITINWVNEEAEEAVEIPIRRR